MKQVLVIAIATLGLLSSTYSVTAQDDHDHDHSDIVGFASLDDGWVVLEDVSAEIRSAITARDMNALHDLSLDLHAVADSLGKLSGDVPQANQLRFASSVNQLRSLSDRLHMAHEQNNEAAAQQMVPQLNGIVQLIMANAEAN